MLQTKSLNIIPIDGKIYKNPKIKKSESVIPFYYFLFFLHWIPAYQDA